MESAFTLATWNILATAYIRPDFYPNSPPHVLSTRWRVPVLGQKAEELNVDILCLQEVEDETFMPIQGRLEPLGYSGSFAKKGRRKPDGCATFFRTDRCRLLAERRLVFADGIDGPSSGNVAQVMALDVLDVRLDVVNTHFKWDPPGTPRERMLGYRQASLALSALPAPTPAGVQIICGDFNVTSDSPVIELFTAAGFDHTHHARPGVFTCNSSRQPKLIDYIFYRGPVRAEGVPVPQIDGETALPSPEQPSDHLPLIAQFTCR